jgi:hypothetical protein
MQAPPPGPIGPGGYPRPEGYGQPQKFGADMAVGVIMIVLNAIGACFGGLALLGGGMASGMSDALKQQMAKQGQNMTDEQLKAAGGAAMIVGIELLLGTILIIVGAVGIIKGARWGFTMTFAVGLILAIASLFPMDLFGLLFGLFGAVYSGLRLFGNVGPRPT